MVAKLDQAVLGDAEIEDSSEKENCPPVVETGGEVVTSEPGTERSVTREMEKVAVDEKLQNAEERCVPFFHSSHFSNVPPTVFFPFPPKRAGSHWIGYWGRHLSASDMKDIFPYQKVNHFPGNFHIGRKDHLWRNISKFRMKYGRDMFDFLPETYVLPKDLRKLKAAMRRGPPSDVYILKPPASARGSGIRLISSWAEVERDETVVAQRYISNPLLIDDHKFDLRIYAYVTSLNPLRVYLYDDGIVRFASCSYSNSRESLSNQYIHLTNYSINKHASMNQSSTKFGLKWSLRQLWNYLAERGHDVPKLMEQIVDLVIKTFICCEPPMSQFVVKFTSLPSICHELFGFDVILDADLKPWLVEVNISPSMQCNSDVDYEVKKPLIIDVLNLSGIQVPPPNAFKSARKSILQISLHENVDCRFMDLRTKPRFHLLGDRDKIKSGLFLEKHIKTTAVEPTILNDLTPSDLRILIDTEDELDRKGHFQRVFPAPMSSKYLKFFDPPRYANLLLDEWTRRFFEDRESGIAYIDSYCQKWCHAKQ